jgi:ArsR family transcriptional regulator, lead/cadmium/zinc/bismuth-responsive transcriptional repressor
MPLAIQCGLRHHSNMQTHVVIKTLAEVPALDDDQLVEVADVLRLMGEPTRLRILLTCLAQPAPVGELAARLDISRSLVSHHLRLLRSSRLLRATRDGKQVIYSEADDRVRCIVTDLAQHVLGAPEDDD